MFDGFDESLGRHTLRKFDSLHCSAWRASGIIRGVADRAVGVVEDQDFIAFLKFERAQHGIDACRGVIDKNEIFAFRSKKISDLVRRCPEPWWPGRHRAKTSSGKFPQKKMRR